MAEMKTISVEQLGKIAASQTIDLVDVRTPVEFQSVHATNARSVPLDTISPQAVIDSKTTHSDEPIYLICKMGGRSAKAVQQFLAAGHTNVVNVEGGTDAWVAAGLPSVRGRKAVSLERQVRIAAGFLVLAGAVPGFFVHKNFIGISAFVGAGLMFAGITNTCAMGMLIAKMPWNKN